VERTVVWLRGRRLLADDGENDRSRWLIDRLPGGDGDGRSYSNDDVIEIAVIPEPADPRRIRGLAYANEVSRSAMVMRTIATTGRIKFTLVSLAQTSPVFNRRAERAVDQAPRRTR